MGSLLSTPNGVLMANECVIEPLLMTSKSTTWVPATLGLAGVIVNSDSLSRTTAGPPVDAAAGLGPPREVAASVRSAACLDRVCPPPPEPQPAISAAITNSAADVSLVVIDSKTCRGAESFPGLSARYEIGPARLGADAQRPTRHRDLHSLDP